MPKPALGSSESSSKIISNKDNWGALNKVQFKKLTKLDKQLKSKESKLQKIKDQIAKLKKSK